jgi:hypothetical protein
VNEIPSAAVASAVAASALETPASASCPPRECSVQSRKHRGKALQAVDGLVNPSPGEGEIVDDAHALTYVERQALMILRRGLSPEVVPTQKGVRNRYGVSVPDTNGTSVHKFLCPNRLRKIMRVVEIIK